MKLPAISGPLFALFFVCTFSHAQTPDIHFMKVVDQEMLDWASQWEAERFGLALRPGGYGICPLDRDTAILFGELTTGAASVRSVLLRSGDSGKTWKEVMAPVRGSQVADVFFHNKQVGWALVLWTTEGPGDLTLYRSGDGGQSWQKVSEIPKRHYMGVPVSMSFSDERNGIIKMLYDGSNEETDGLATLSTKDGGLSWCETGRLTLDQYQKLQTETEETEDKPVTSQDGSQWKLHDTYKEVRVFRRSKADEAWKLLCVMPGQLGYSKGEVLIHPPSRARS